VKRIEYKFLLLAIVTVLLGANLTVKAITAVELGSDPGFDIMNKDSRPIWAALVVDGKFLGTLRINSNAAVTKIIDPSKDIVIGVYYSDPGSVSLGFFAQILDKVEINPKPDFIFGFEPSARGKTKYLTWNPAKHNKPNMNFYPQTGPLMGFLGKSEGGYSLKYNVKQADIRLKATK